MSEIFHDYEMRIYLQIPLRSCRSFGRCLEKIANKRLPFVTYVLYVTKTGSAGGKRCQSCSLCTDQINVTLVTLVYYDFNTSEGSCMSSRLSIKLLTYLICPLVGTQKGCHQMSCPYRTVS